MATAGPSKNFQSGEIKEQANPAGATVNERKKGEENTERSRDRNKRQTDLKHILLSPDLYIGSNEPVKDVMWVYEEEAGMHQREITYVPGLVKIFDQILINAADNKDRNPKMNTIKVDIDLINHVISVFNNGTSLCVRNLGEGKVYLPYVGVGYLLDRSDYEDENYGPKLMVLSNVFSTIFEIETGSKKEEKKFKQTWINNMTRAGIARASSHKGADFTRITFSPDLTRFKMDSLDKDTVALLYRRAFDVAATTRGVKVLLNGNPVPVKNFKDYVNLCLEGKKDDAGSQLKCVYEAVSERWEIAVAPSDKGFQQVSFANSIATTKGGTHVDYVTDIVLKHLNDFLENSGTPVDMDEIKNHLWIFVNCKVDNPTFESKIQDIMTLKVELFGSACEPSDQFFKKLSKSDVIAKFKPKGVLKKSKVPTRRCPGRAAKVNQGNYFVAAKKESTTVRKLVKRKAVKRAASATPSEAKRKRTGKKSLETQVERTAPVRKTTKVAQEKAVQSTTSTSQNIRTVPQGTIAPPTVAVVVQPKIVRVANFPEDTPRSHIGSLLSTAGEIQWIAVMALQKDPSKKEALVKFKNEQNADRAVSVLDGYLVGSMQWRITHVDQKQCWGDFIIPDHMVPYHPQI